MHEMPMTTAPIRPTVPALRPFLDSPPACSPVVGASGVAAFGSAHRCSPSWRLVGCGVRRSSERAVRAASSRRSSRGTGAGAGRDGSSRRATSSPGSQSRCATASSMLSPRADDDLGSRPSGSAARALASTSSAWAAPATRMTPVSTEAGRSTVTSETRRRWRPSRSRARRPPRGGHPRPGACRSRP